MVADNPVKHYYSREQSSKLKIDKIQATFFDNDLYFFTGSGVFSIKKIDTGTEVLINNAILKDKWRILDIGCGYGAVGISIAKSFSKSEIVMTDVNKRAVMLTKKNIKLNSVKNVKVVDGDLYKPIKDTFDTILTNPPQSAGKEICFKIIEEAPKYLNPKGLLQLVARHNKGGKHLSDKMNEVFGNVKVIARKSGYRVYVSENV